MAKLDVHEGIDENLSVIRKYLKGQFLGCHIIVLFFGLFTMLQANHSAFAASEITKIPCEIPPGNNALRADRDVERGTHIISGELIGMDGDYFIVKDEKGDEVSLLSDKRTDKPVIKKGDRITAYVDYQNYALWIRSNESTDRRSEHASVDCNPN